MDTYSHFSRIDSMDVYEHSFCLDSDFKSLNRTILPQRIVFSRYSDRVLGPLKGTRAFAYPITCVCFVFIVCFTPLGLFPICICGKDYCYMFRWVDFTFLASGSLIIIASQLESRDRTALICSIIRAVM